MGREAKVTCFLNRIMGAAVISKRKDGKFLAAFDTTNQETFDSARSALEYLRKQTSIPDLSEDEVMYDFEQHEFHSH